MDLIFLIENLSDEELLVNIPFKMKLTRNKNEMKEYNLKIPKGESRILIVEITTDQETIGQKFYQLEKDLQIFN
jgi:hypothetical protein